MNKQKISIEDIESQFFEYKKLEGLFRHRIGIEVGRCLCAPNEIAEQMIYSRLLIDLLSIVDSAVEIMFVSFGFRQLKGKSKLTILLDNGKLYRNSYLLWYKEWRNDVAHHFRIIPSYSLRQASDDVQHQLREWQLITKHFEANAYQDQVNDNTFRYGTMINGIPALIYRITYHDGDSKKRLGGCGWDQEVNLSLKEYLTKKSKSQ